MSGTQMHRVVIVGGGFAGLSAARALTRAPVEVTLLDRRNFHLFQPLLYQVATGGLSAANIAAPLRSLLARQRNTRVLLAEVVDIDAAGHRVRLDDGTELPYDTLIVATGARHHYFGNDQWERLAPGLKTIEDATEIRRRVLLAFEMAERESDAAARAAQLTFVVVGAGPTGVELAGAIAEIAHRTLPGNFRAFDPRVSRILLVEAGDRVLGTYPPALSAKAQASLAALGVEVRVDTTAAVLDAQGLTLRHASGEERIAARTVLWAAGVRASPLGLALARATGAQTDRAGRVMTGPDCAVPGHPGIFVLGDLAHQPGSDGQPLPGVAQVAMQQGAYVARLVRERLRGRTLPPFRYRNLGNMATIGRNHAVADLGWWRFSGFLAWLAWLFIHLMHIVNFQNRLLVLVQWGWNYVTLNRSARLITGEPGPQAHAPAAAARAAAGPPAFSPTPGAPPA